MTHNITSFCVRLEKHFFSKPSTKLFSVFLRAYSRYKSFKMSQLIPPINVRGMTELDRDKFKTTVEVSALKMSENCLSDVMKYVKKYLLKMENLKPVQTLREVAEQEEKDSYKYAFLDPNKINSWEDIGEEERIKLEKFDVHKECLIKHKLQLSYENWSNEEILKSILPEDSENVTSFSKIGHIVHLNLREQNMAYKKIIGEVMLDKIANCKTVINKTSSIDNTYRNFNLELLAGEENYLTTVKENKCNFEFDFSLVYWNSRLCTEHERIINKLKPGDYLFDIFSGVGPFAIPAAKNKVTVYANDLNPVSYKWLTHNAQLNKTKQNYITCFNLDGRQFIKDVFVKYYLQILQDLNDDKIPEKSEIHVTMNLPALAVEFLDTFKGIIKSVPSSTTKFKDPILHVYCFAVGDTPVETALQMVQDNLGLVISKQHLIEVFNVRNVSPKKEMMRVSFHLPHTHMLDSLSLDGIADIPAQHNVSNKRKTSSGEESCNNKCIKL